MYDIIGDIHGEAEKLHHLLLLLGYRHTPEGYQHLRRKAIFLGDFINKGPDSREVLHIVRQMITHGSAHAVLGNHELYLIGHFHKHAGGSSIREHNEKNNLQLAPTFTSFAGHEKALEEDIRWLQTLPLFLELEGIRLVHACWHQDSIQLIRQQYPQNCLDDALLQDMQPDGALRKAVEELLVAPRLPLPEASPIPSFKVRWWALGKSQSYQTLANRADPAVRNPQVSKASLSIEDYHYPEEEVPLFFGHYNLPEQPGLLAPNYCCLDFNPGEQRLLTAYRWDGESQLKEEHLLFVGA